MATYTILQQGNSNVTENKVASITSSTPPLINGGSS